MIPPRMKPYIRFSFMLACCIAAGYAFYATGRHPYHFYVTTRWIVFLTCCWGVVRCVRRLWPSFAPAYALVGIVFNPLVPFHFARATWHNLDIAAGVILLASLAFHNSPKKSNHDDSH